MTDAICCLEDPSALACAEVDGFKTVEAVIVKKRARWATTNIERLLPDLQSSDEEVRGNAVRGLCPCHAGWDVFEQHVGIIFRSLRDGSHAVRAHALHVFEDAAHMQSAADLRHHLEAGEERISDNLQEYWVFYSEHSVTSDNEIGRITTSAFDEY